MYRAPPRSVNVDPQNRAGTVEIDVNVGERGIDLAEVEALQLVPVPVDIRVARHAPVVPDHEEARRRRRVVPDVHHAGCVVTGL